jgi:hypothetical protein
MKKTGWREGKVKKYRSEAVKAGYLKERIFRAGRGRFAKDSVGFVAGPNLVQPPTVGAKKRPTVSQP